MERKIKRRKLTGALAVSILIFSVPVAVLATEISGRASNIKSHGTIEYKGKSDTVRIDSSDLIYLAEEIDNLEKAAKWGNIQALKAIGTEMGAEEDKLSDISFTDINDAIRKSQATDALPSSDEIVSGREVWANGEKITGTMENHGVVGVDDLRAGESYQIPSGYSEGGVVSAASLESQTQATATAADIASGATAWVNGIKVTGTGEGNEEQVLQEIVLELNFDAEKFGIGTAEIVLIRQEDGTWECSTQNPEIEKMLGVSVGKVVIGD